MGRALTAALVLGCVLTSTGAMAQGDLFGANRERPEPRAEDVPPPPSADRPYETPSGVERPRLRRVRLLGDDAVFRLESVTGMARTHRDLRRVPVVLCERAPCEVWLPAEASLAVQQRGTHRAQGALVLPPEPGTLEIRYRSVRGKRITGGLIFGGLATAGSVILGTLGSDPWFGEVFIGIGVAMIVVGLVMGVVFISRRPKPQAIWTPAAPGTLSWR